jgi:hypothetical protein
VIVGAWLFGFGDPVWLSVPMLLALVTPRLRDGPRIPLPIAVLLVQNLPALVVLGLVVRDVATQGELSELVAVLAAATILVAALRHGRWFVGRRGPVAGLGRTRGLVRRTGGQRMARPAGRGVLRDGSVAAARRGHRFVTDPGVA